MTEYGITPEFYYGLAIGFVSGIAAVFAFGIARDMVNDWRERRRGTYIKRTWRDDE